MARKIFITYKYADDQVAPIPTKGATTVRTYVDALQSILDAEDHINKGELDDADLSQFKDPYIQTQLGEKIFDSSLTVVMISKGMLDKSLPEKEQWMPWEISYSLKNKSRGDRSSRPNAMLAIVLPDTYSRYDYYLIDEACPICKCRTINTPFLFKILATNMFNIKAPTYTKCENHISGSGVFAGQSSYIHSVKWSDFEKNPNKFISIALEIGENLNLYEITTELG